MPDQEPPRPDYETLAHEMDLCPCKPLGTADMFQRARWLEARVGQFECVDDARREDLLNVIVQVDALTAERNKQSREADHYAVRCAEAGAKTERAFKQKGEIAAKWRTAERERDEARAEVEAHKVNVRLATAKYTDAMSALRACRDAHEDVMGWIGNWDPKFTEDGEWPDTRDKSDAALAQATVAISSVPSAMPNYPR